MSQLQCLLVEDDVDDQEIFQMALDQVDKEATCTIASNGIEALSLLNSDQYYSPQLIFVDINMPLMNGIEFLTELRKLGRCDQSKVFLYSTSMNSNVYEAAKNLAVTDLIKKPDNIDKLLDVLEKIVAPR